MIMKERHRTMAQLPTLHQAAWFMLALPLFVASCMITDHSEKGHPDDQVTSEFINHPASGYQDVDTDDLPVLTFEQSHFDMGRIVQGSKVEHRFMFQNTGGSALLISDVRASCGCTVGKEWPRYPVKPGDKAEIVVAFDSEGRVGVQNKTVTVVANTSPPSTVLTLTGEVIGPVPEEEVE